MALDQYLLLRVLWKEHRDRRTPNSFLGLQKWITLAESKLANYRSWSTYCDNFETNKPIPEGNFALVRYYQLEVTQTRRTASPEAFDTPIAKRTRSQTLKQVRSGMGNLYLESPIKKNTNLPDDFNFDSEEEEEEDEPSFFQPESPVPQELAKVIYPPTKDEQITLHRKAFTADFESAKFEARTDGYLDDHQGKPRAIIEVKPVMRSTKLPAIRMQEGAQVVAWIKSDDHEAERNFMTRLHISQDRNKIFVNVAKCDEAYLDHLNNPQPSTVETTPSFLTMHQFGPWDILNAADMKELGPILLAISLRADYESKQGK